MPAPGPFSVLLEREEGGTRCALEEEYGAPLLIGTGRVAVNFVSTVDGVVSLGMAADDSRAVGGGVVADRTLMAMLRAVAGVIVVGAGTLRATRNHQWTATSLAPDRGRDLVNLRAAAGRPAAPAPLLVVSRSGELPTDAVALTHPAVPVHVVTAGGAVSAGAPMSPRGGAVAESDGLSAATILDAASVLGRGGPVLCEGGPHLFGTLLGGGVPIELFLTIAPQLVGASGPAWGRLSLVEGVALPAFARPGELRSVRRAGDHLLLRYSIDVAAGAGEVSSRS